MQLIQIQPNRNGAVCAEHWKAIKKLAASLWTLESRCKVEIGTLVSKALRRSDLDAFRVVDVTITADTIRVVLEAPRKL